MAKLGQSHVLNLGQPAWVTRLIDKLDDLARISDAGYVLSKMSKEIKKYQDRAGIVAEYQGCLNKFKDSSKKLKKGIVFAASLYL